MAEMQRFILRVLTGPNAGAEALLGERTTIGSAETDDITIGDGALAPGHFTIEVTGGAINVVVGDSPLALKDPIRAATPAASPVPLAKGGQIARSRAAPDDAARLAIARQMTAACDKYFFAAT